MSFSRAQLCFCGQPPRTILDGYAICRCTNLVYRPTKPVMNPWDEWEVIMASELRRDLIKRAKAKVGVSSDGVAAPENLQAAVEAARLIGEHGFANDIAYEQWIASLEVLK
jgi:hypothetical protein